VKDGDSGRAGALHVPDAVWDETVGEGPIAPLALANLRRHTVRAIIELAHEQLREGEH